MTEKQKQKTAVATRPPNKISTVREMLDKSKAQIKAALPKFMDMPRFLRVAMTSIQRNPTLLDCEPITLVGAIIQAAQLGLELDGTLGHAYLVPFWNNRKGRREVQFIAGYKGLIALVRRSKEMAGIEARVVHDKDTFLFEFGTNAMIKHVPFPSTVDAGAPIAFYAIARMRDGTGQFDVMQKYEVDKIMFRSPSKDKEGKIVGPWLNDYEEMGKKTVIRRLIKVLPVTIETQKAVTLDERTELGLPQDLGMLADESEIPTPGETEAVSSVAMPKKLEAVPQQESAPVVDKNGNLIEF